jgi:glycine cleavage system H protein
MTVKYTEEHEWIQLEDHEPPSSASPACADAGRRGVRRAAGSGAGFTKGEVAGVVESVKAAADVYMPIAGEVTEVNEERADPARQPRPMGNGWSSRS